MNSRVIGIGLVVIIAAVAIGAVLATRKPEPSGQLPPAAIPPQSSNQHAGIIATTTSGQHSYTNTLYGFQFTYPGGWRVGENSLNFVQLYNFPLSTAAYDAKGFAKNQNKVEAAVADSVSTAPSSGAPDYVPISLQRTQITVANEIATRTDTEFAGGLKIRTYLLPIGPTPNKSLSISIYGDSANFGVLDEIVRSITWVK